MSPRANVTSVEAIESFRSNLIIYLEPGAPGAGGGQRGVLRTRLWLENEQWTHWENECATGAEGTGTGPAALFSAKLSNLSQVDRRWNRWLFTARNAPLMKPRPSCGF